MSESVQSNAGMKKFSEMTKDEINALPRCLFRMRQIVSRKTGDTYYRASVDFGSGICVDVDRDRFGASSYLNIVSLYGKEKEAVRGDVVLRVPFVMSSGRTIREDGTEFSYVSYDVLLYVDAAYGEVIHFAGFLDSNLRMFLRHNASVARELRIVDRGLTDKSAIPDYVFSDSYLSTRTADDNE